MREPWLEPLLRQLRINKVKPRLTPGSRVLDIGCGQGEFLFQIKNLVSQGLGLDQKTEDFQVGNLEIKNYRLRDRLDIESESFDTVTLLAVLEHLEFPRAILAEIRRVLKPGGRLVLTVPSKRAQPILEFCSWLGLLDRQGIQSHRRYYDRYSLRTALEQAGLTVGKVESFEMGFNFLAVAQKD